MILRVFIYILTKIKSDDVSTTLRDLKNKWMEIAPDQPFDFFFWMNPSTAHTGLMKNWALYFLQFYIAGDIGRLPGPLWIGVFYRRTTHQRNRHP